MPATILGIHADDALDKITHYSVDVTNQSKVIVSDNDKRRYLLLVNDDNEDIYISIGVPAELHHGIRINKNGGSMQFSLCITSVSLCAVHAIQASVNPKRLLITEGE